MLRHNKSERSLGLERAGDLDHVENCLDSIILFYYLNARDQILLRIWSMLPSAAYPLTRDWGQVRGQ
jgi:hypothetical protein